MPFLVIHLTMAVSLSFLVGPAEAGRMEGKDQAEQPTPEDQEPGGLVRPDPVLLPGRSHEVRELANGLRVSVLAAPDLPLVAVQHWVHAGSMDQDLPHQAHMVEHLVFSGTPAHPAGAYPALHDRWGGSFQATTASEYTLYESIIPAEASGELLALSADRLGPRSFDAEAVEHAQVIVAEEVRLRSENSPFSRMSAAVLAAKRGQLGVDGEVPGHEAVAQLDLARCQSFFDREYRPGRMHLVVVGPVDPAEVFLLAETHYGSWPASETPDGLAEDPPTRPGLPGLLVVSDDIPKVRIAAAVYPLPAIRSSNYPAARLMLRTLNGSAGDQFAMAYRKLGPPSGQGSALH